MISVIRYWRSSISSLPRDLHVKAVNSSFEFSATARKVLIKQLATDAVNKCSGDHIPATPFGNCGGVATWMHPPSPAARPVDNSGEHMIPFLSSFQVTSTL